MQELSFERLSASINDAKVGVIVPAVTSFLTKGLLVEEIIELTFQDEASFVNCIYQPIVFC